YVVKEVLPNGDTETFGAAGYTITPTSGVNSTGDNFANVVNFSISGTKYTDVNGLDNQTAIGNDDTPLGGITIDLFDGPATTVITSTTTAPNGTYSFPNLPTRRASDLYVVKEVLPNGDTETFGKAGYTITPTSGVNVTGDNFANFVNFSISGTKYTD